VNENKRGAAFFDIDGTLLPGTSMEMLFARALLRGRLPGRFRWLPFLIEAIRLAPHGLTTMRKANKAFLAGAKAEDVRDWGEQVFRTDVLPRLDERRRVWIDRERGRGRSIILLSGMPDLLMHPFMRHFAPDLGIATPLEVDPQGRLTGRRAGAHPYGRIKVVIARDLAGRSGWGPKDCSAYGDHASDAHLLAWVGEAYAVDPDAGLRRAALRHGWRILEGGGERANDLPASP